MFLAEQGTLFFGLCQFCGFFTGTAWIFDDRIHYAAGQMHTVMIAESMQLRDDAETLRISFIMI